MSEELKTLYFNYEKGIFLLNDKSIGEEVDEFKLCFEEGEWTLAIRETKRFGIRGHIKNMPK